MTDEFHPPDGPAADRASPAPADPLDEPFACPHCGQMLAPTCRVCVVCREPIDPAQIRRAPAPVSPEAPARAPAGGPAQPLPGSAAKPPLPTVPPVRYPWRMLLLVLGLTWLGAAAALMLLGLEQARFLVTGVQILSSLWVFFDARQKRLPKPFHWGLGTLFLWIVFFPWYLVRRKRPEAPCPFVEREPSPLARVILLVLALFFLIALVAALLHGPR